MEEVVNSTEETKSLAGKLAKDLEVGAVLALYGNLGTGKTTFTRFLVEALGIVAKVQSPSFILARVYERNKDSLYTNKEEETTKCLDSPTLETSQIEKVNHLDLYRLQNPKELEGLGLEEYFWQKNSVTIIEWPEIAENILPANTVRIIFEDLGGNSRRIYFK
ncbi:MAG TPA: tRNA (adenosine(37)-N6)-threonylcarbamoyltransferase complex ATPase subunit type 1 TsaE [bacterium]|nr:tRNA (adenosine(37)-N6)-threonylcarbamoyltransferase complex ATPase subunit type 1 TsaE [bacterium]